MRPAVRNTSIAGLFFLLGVPLLATLLAFLQRPAASSGPSKSIGEIISTVLVANFACFPFIVLGLILLIIAWVLYRSPQVKSPA